MINKCLGASLGVIGFSADRIRKFFIPNSLGPSKGTKIRLTGEEIKEGAKRLRQLIQIQKSSANNAGSSIKNNE